MLGIKAGSVEQAWPNGRSQLRSLVLLAGCSSPTDVAVAGGPSGDPAVAVGMAQDVMEFDGSLLGVGYWTDATGGFFAGAFTPQEEFTVREGATRITFDLTWDHPVPHAIWLYYLTPEPWGEAVEATPEQMLAGALSATAEAPPPGVWAVTARATGVAAEVPYHITVTVDYAT